MQPDDPLVARVYQQLRQLAQGLVPESATLQPTELVHEAWARLDGRDFNGPTHYRSVAALAMRQILVDHARAAGAQKRSGLMTTLTDITDVHPFSLVELSHLLEQLEARDVRAYQVVCLRYLGGMTAQETADQLGLSRRTVQSTWKLARAWLILQLQ